jgi:hypothetical protein
LRKNGISFKHKSTYQENYEKELDDYSKESELKTKELLNNLKLKHPLLFEKYPKFSNS